MSKANLIQFAVVREDPNIEVEIAKGLDAKKVLLIASGGCTAFNINCCLPDVEVTLYDTNPEQLRLVRKKMEFLRLAYEERDLKMFGVGNDNPEALDNCGNFEALFRDLSKYIWDKVVSRNELEEAFKYSNFSEKLFKKIVENKHWAEAFEKYFNDDMLNSVFGPAATQHAKKGSYPAYFKNAIESGLLREDACTNYFLHHILLGCYTNRPEAIPHYLICDHETTERRLKYVDGDIFNVKDIGSFDIIGLSNIFDWMAQDEVEKHAELLNKNCKQGAAIIFRQLNNDKNYKPFFQDHFHFDRRLADVLLEKDRSLFYSKLNIGFKKGN